MIMNMPFSTLASPINKESIYKMNNDNGCKVSNAMKSPGSSSMARGYLWCLKKEA